MPLSEPARVKTDLQQLDVHPWPGRVGANWLSKPHRGHADHVFYPASFGNHLASQTMVYHFTANVLNSNCLRRDTRQPNRLMQRLLVCAREPEPNRALEAVHL